MMPTLPLLVGWDFSQPSAAAQSATTLSSATPPWARTVAVDVVGGAVAESAVQVRADDDVAVVGEAAGELLIQLVPAGHVVNQDDAGERAIARRVARYRRG